MRDTPAVKRNLYAPSITRRFFYDCVLDNSKYDRNSFDRLIFGKKRVYVTASNSFNQYTLRSGLGDIFRPSEALQSRIRAITDGWNRPVIGVHVRRTDCTASINHAPLSNYYAKMDEEVERDSGTKFYLASDSRDVKRQMVERYGDAIVLQNLTLKRNSVNGMQDAVLELYTLASCAKILGSRYSTYSLVASRIYDIPFISCDS